MNWQQLDGGCRDYIARAEVMIVAGNGYDCQQRKMGPKSDKVAGPNFPLTFVFQFNVENL